MRVLHAITRGDVGGAQTQVVELAIGQRVNGDDVTIVTGVDGPAMDRARGAGIDVRVVEVLAPAGRSTRSRRWGRGAVRVMRREIAEIGPDVVHGHSSAAGLVARLAARREHVPAVYTAHGWPFQRGAPWRQRLASLLGEFVGGHVGSAVICLTDRERRLALRAHVVPAHRVWVVPNAIADIEGVRATPGRGHDGRVGIVMVARFAPPKRQRELIDVLASLTDLPWTMTFVGGGPELDSARAAALRLGDRVRFTGDVDDVAERLAANDVFVLWSGYEGMPISLLEAMRAGLCCVASDLPGVRAVIGEPAVGLVAGDATELAAALRSVIDDPALRTSWGSAARARFESAYSLGAMVAATRTVYESVLRH